MMSTELTLTHYKGKWRFQGQTPFGFDELDLTIDDDKAQYSQRLNGRIVKTGLQPRDAHFFGEFLVFTSSGIDPFYVARATEKTMICGQFENRKIGVCKWEVEVIRK